MDYNIWADLLNKFSQLTPWVQALLGLAVLGGTTALGYFMKEIIVAIVAPLFQKRPPLTVNELVVYTDENR